MTELKAYSCLEPYEYTGAVIFAKSNIEARRKSADEFHDGEIGGMIVKRAPWADEYGSRGNIPILVMVENGWHFECSWSGIRIDSDLYRDGTYIYNKETKEDEWSGELIGKTPVGNQDSICFACQEYADQWNEYKRIEKEFNDKQLEYFRDIVRKRLPDAIIDDAKDGYMRHESITSFNMKSDWFHGLGPRYVQSVHIPIIFPGRKHWAGLEFRQPHYGQIGPIEPAFICANGDLEAFQAFVDQQKEKYNL